MEEAVILKALRSPMCKSNKGSFINTRIDDIASQVVKELIKDLPEKLQNQIEDIIVGCATPEASQGLNIARNISFLSHLPLSCGGSTVNRFCASSLEAINIASQYIMCGNGDLFIAGGVEHMTQVAMGGFNPSLNKKLMSPNMPAAYINMGITAENLADQYNISREEQDRFALNSHKKAVDAINKKIFEKEIVPIKTTDIISTDECPRANTSTQTLSKLETVFKKNGTVTAGNSSPLTDGVSFVLISSKSFAKKNKIKPLAKIKSTAVAGVDPSIMGIGPVYAVPKALQRAKIKLNKIDLIELNEAFAAQSLAVIKELNIDHEKLNINGGAIALGHPLGASGARIITTLIHSMITQNKSLGLATMCVGGGQGVATIIEQI